MLNYELNLEMQKLEKLKFILHNSSFILHPLKGVPQPDEHRRPVFAEADVDPAKDVGADERPEADAGVELEAAGIGPVEGLHYRAEVDEGGQFPIRGHIEDLPTEQPDPFLQVEEKIARVDEAVAAVAAQGRFPPEDASLQEGDVVAEGLVVGEAERRDVAGLVQGDEPLHFRLVVPVVGAAAEDLRAVFRAYPGIAAEGRQVRRIEGAVDNGEFLGMGGEAVDSGHVLHREAVADKRYPRNRPLDDVDLAVTFPDLYLEVF